MLCLVSHHGRLVTPAARLPADVAGGVGRAGMAGAPGPAGGAFGSICPAGGTAAGEPAAELCDVRVRGLVTPDLPGPENVPGGAICTAGGIGRPESGDLTPDLTSGLTSFAFTTWPPPRPEHVRRWSTVQRTFWRCRAALLPRRSSSHRPRDAGPRLVCWCGCQACGYWRAVPQYAAVSAAR